MGKFQMEFPYLFELFKMKRVKNLLINLMPVFRYPLPLFNEERPTQLEYMLTFQLLREYLNQLLRSIDKRLIVTMKQTNRFHDLSVSTALCIFENPDYSILKLDINYNHL